MMKVKTKRVRANYRIVVEVHEPWVIDGDPEKAHKQWAANLNSVAADIKRHVDGCIRIDPDWDTEYVCVYCGSNPEPDPKTGEPVCCDKAVDDYNNKPSCPYCGTELVKRDTTALGGDETFDWCPDCERVIEDGERMEAADAS